jgi:hypothetical protein
MLEKLGFQRLVEETLTVKRATRAMSMYQFVLAMVLALYVGFSRLHHLRFLEREPMRVGILKVLRLPAQCTFWQFLASLHLERACAALPPGVKSVYARADSGFYCGEAVEAYERRGCQFIISARKTARLVDELKAAEWKPSPRTDADGQCEFRYQPEGWEKPYRFIALRYEKEPRPREAGEPEQYQLFETADYRYRVFVTNLRQAVDLLVWFYNQRAGAENLIKEANNDAGLAAYPSARWAMNCNTQRPRDHFRSCLSDGTLAGLTHPERTALDPSQRLFDGPQKVTIAPGSDGVAGAAHRPEVEVFPPASQMSTVG